MRNNVRAPRQWGVGPHLLTVVAIVLIPLIAFSAALIWQFDSAERTRVEREAVELGKRVSAVTDRKLSATLGALQVLATSRLISDRNDADLYKQAEEVKQIIGGEVIIKDVSGQQIVNTRLPFGAVLPSSLPEADKLALQSGRPFISDVFIGTVSKQPVISLYAPVIREGVVTGLVITGYSPDYFAASLVDQKLPPDWVVVIVDGGFKIVARSRRQEEFVGSLTGPNVRQNDAPFATWSGQTLDGVQVLSALYRSEFSGWRTVVGVPEAIIAATYRSFVRWLAFVGFLALAASVVVAMLFSRSMTVPLEQLSGAALALGRGESFNPISSNITEINTISRSLTQASDDLAKHNRTNESLINELNHRVKNTLASVQAIASQTFTRSSNPEEFKAAFEGRLLALSKTHNALTETGWLGADLQDLIGTVCSALCSEGQLSTHGEKIDLPPRSALNLGLILHELCTNAAKYGALSVLAGRIEVSWTKEGSILQFKWEEKNGPPVSKPTRRGFGSRFIVSSLRDEPGEEVDFQYRQTGLVVTAKIALARHGDE
jgi:two-component sensor histidine kinase